MRIYAKVYAKGKRGIIYKQGDTCIKEHNPSAAVNTIRKEADWLKRLNKHRIGPRFIKYEHGKLHRRFVKGTHIKDFLDEEEDKKKIISVLKQVLDQCRKMDELGINKKELTNPCKDIIITWDNKAVMIDFERCYKTSKPKNTTQFLQYIARNKELLESRGLSVDKKRLISLGRDYKTNPGNITFSKIIRFISNS